MSHYLTQPEEIDYILMMEQQESDADSPLDAPSGQHALNNSQLARLPQNNSSTHHY